MRQILFKIYHMLSVKEKIVRKPTYTSAKQFHVCEVSNLQKARVGTTTQAL